MAAETQRCDPASSAGIPFEAACLAVAGVVAAGPLILTARGPGGREGSYGVFRYIPSNCTFQVRPPSVVASQS